MDNAWTIYKTELLAKMPSLAETLNPGASEADIQAAESEMGVTFPDAMRALYLANDGDNEESACGMILGFHFHSLADLQGEWRSECEYADDPDLNRESAFTSEPAGCIKRRYADKKWLPLCNDGGGNYIGIDLDPDVNGKIGQIINFGRDEHDKVVLAESLDAFFARLTRIIRSEDFFVGEFDGEEVVFFGADNEEDGCAHLTEYLVSEESVQ